MTKQVLDIGNCRPDHAAIRSLIEGAFDASVTQAHGMDDALAVLRTTPFTLVLVNRQMDRDRSSGLAVIEKIKSTPEVASTPVMMITNFADHQELAVQAGAERGFGKRELADPATREKLAAFLG
jgi:CheY-like chemotaxis protein